MVDSTLYPFSESVYQGLEASGVGNTSYGRSILPPREEQKTGPSAEAIDAFKAAAVKYNVPADVLMSMAEKDSNFNEFNRSRGPGAKVRGIINVSDEEVSRRDGGNPYDPAQNIDTAARKLRSYMDAGMSIRDAIKAHAGGVDKSKWGPDVEAYGQDVMSRTQRLAEQFIPEAAPRVVETETHRDAKGQAVPPTVEEQRQMFGISDPGRPGIGQQLGEDVQRGTANLANIGRGLKGMAQAAIGDEAGAKATLDEYVKREYLNARENPAVIGSYKNVKDFGDAGRYAVEAIGENAAMFLPALATGGIGAVAGRGIVERAAVRFIEDQVAKGMSREAAETLAAKMVERGITVGAAAGAAPSTMGMETGSIGGDIYKETGQIRPGVAAVGGAAAGALDLVEPVMAIKKAFGPSVAEPVKDMVISAIAKRIGVEGLKQFAVEAGTEGLQTIIEQASTRNVDGKALFTPELLDEVVDSALKGGIGGGVMGVGSQVANEIAEPRAVPQPAPERKEPTIEAGSPPPPVAAGEAVKEIAAEAPGRQTSADLQAVEQAASKPSTARPGGQGPLSRILETGAPEVAPLATAAGERVTMSDEMGSLTGAVISQDAEGVLFKSDDGLEQLISNQDIVDGKVRIAKGGEAPVSQVPVDGAETNFGTMPEAPAPAAEPVVSQEAPVAAPAQTDLAEQAAAAIQPTQKPAERDLSEMSEEELRGKLKFIAQQGKANGWNKLLIQERKKIESAIYALHSDEATRVLSGNAPEPTPIAQNPQPEPIEDKSGYTEPKRADEATMRHLLSDYSMSAKAMQSKIDQYGLNDSHEVVKNDKGRFVILPKAVAPAATQATAADNDAQQAIALGFKFNEAAGKWKHPDAPEYSTSKAKNAVEDHPEIVASKAKRETAQAPAKAAETEAPKSNYGKNKKTPPEQRRFDSVSKAGPVFATKNQYEAGYNVSWASTHIADAGNMVEAARIAEAVATSGADNIEDMRKAAIAAMTPSKAKVETEVGEFGPVHRQFYHDAKAAIERLMADKTGEAVGALHHPDVGDIDLIWGDGKGLSTIVKEHPDVIENLQERISSTKVESRSENRVILHDEKTRAVVRLDYDSKAKTWLMTAYDPEERIRRLADTTERRKSLQEDTSSSSPDTNNIRQNAAPAKTKRDAARRTQKKSKAAQVVEDSQKIARGELPIEDDRERQRLANIAKLEEIEAEKAAEPAASQNTVFTDDAYAAAVARFNKRHKGSKFNSGIDPEDLADGIIMAGYHIEKGARTFSAYAEAMLESLGEKVRPFLKSWYLGVKFDPRGAAFEGMNSAGDVEAFDLASLNGEQNEPAKLDQPSAGPLEGVPADAVQGATESRQAGAGAETGGGADVSRAGPVGRKRNGPARGVGDGQGALSLPAGGTGAERVNEPAAGKRAQDTAADFAISEEDRIGEGGKKTKFKQNVEAIRIVKRLAETQSSPSAADQTALAKYVGWGGIPEAFERSDGSISVGWTKEAKELKELLTADEYSEAAASTQYAHYTAPEVVSAMWDGMRRMGFAGGRVLEPGMGVGNFFGLMPKDLRAASALHGVEKDIITGGVAKGLYPAAKIAAPMDFRDYTIPEGYFDAAIGNPPFASTKIKDTVNRDISGFSLHNYFFAKALNGLKPGGVMSMVVTSRMLDSISDTSRQYMAARADLVAAIRLPNNAFLKNAGTQVTTDIIILRKRKEGEKPSGETWSKVGEYTNEKGQTVPLNEYFIRHPENMLGEFGPFGSMYNPDEPALVSREGQDTPALLREAMARLPQNITSGSAIEVKDESSIDPTSIEHVRVGSAFMRDGKVMLREPDRLGEPQASEATFPSEKAQERVVGMVGVRDAFAKLRALQLNAKATDKQIEAARAELNDVYDKFVRKNGYINEEANKRLFRDDPSWPQISALEDGFSKGITPAVAKSTGQAPAKPSAKKAAIFSKRTQSPYAPPTKAATAKDALLASLSERGRIDLDLMQKLYGKDQDAITKELGDLVYNDPIKGPVTREEYLSGNVKAKLAQAIEAAQNDPAMQRNVDALREVQPPNVEAIDIDVKIGSHWIPIGVMREFAAHLLGNSNKLKVIYNPATAGWTVSGDPDTDAATRWGTSRARVSEVIEAAANQRSIVIRDKQSDGTYVLNEVDTQAANDKVQAVKDEWRRWVFDEDSRRETLAGLYNEMFNTNVRRSFDGSHLTFPGKVGDDVVRLRPHQANAVWRALQSSTTLFDHVVGAGKTFTMIAAAMEMRRMGLAKKPMFTVPNHLVGQWAADFVKLYPNAQILAATKKDFEKENRKKLFARIATGDWDAVIVAHSSFAKVEVDPASQNAFIEKQVADLLKTEEAMRAADGKDSRNVKQVQNRIEKLREKQKRLLDTGAKDDSLYWKELGVDALFLDEAHEFKNLEFSTSMQRVAGLGNQSGSQKASDLYLKVNQVLEATGGRNVVFATGTPISNTMAEMFTMQRYLDGKALEEQGLSHFDAWARLYGDVVTDWELSPSGAYKMNSRFAKFVNMPELMQRYTSFADVINRDDINAQLAERGEKLPVPKIKGGKPQNIVVERSPDQADFMASLVKRAENLPKKVTKGSDNMLKIMSDARKSALDMRLIDPAYPDYAESKVNNAANRIVDLYKKWADDKGTQLVFIDLSTPKGAVAKEQAALRELIAKAESGDEAAQEKLDAMSPDELLALDARFSVYDDLKLKLIERGIPENEIAFIHDATTEQKKEELFGKVKSGRVRVLFGSTAKMGAGMNVQERLVALHHLDAPWRPSDLEQREGRIIRQGNILRDRDPENFEVEINRYAAKATLDSRMWQTIEGKARFIEQVRKGTEGSREIEDVAGEAANAAEMKAAASGNPLILEEMTLRQRVKKLENEERAHRQEQWSIKDRIKQNEKSIAFSEQSLETMREDAKVEIPEEFAMSIRGETFDKRKDAGAKIMEEAFSMRDAGATSAAIGSYGGFKITLHYRPEALVFHMTLKGKGEYTSSSFQMSADPQGVAQRVVVLARETRDLASVEKGIAERKTIIGKLNSQVKDWPKKDELAEAKKRHSDIIAELKPKQKPAEAPAEEPKASIGSGAGMSPADLVDTLTSGKDGSIIKAMIDSGKVVIEATGAGMPAGAQAVTMPDGTIRLIASNVDASTARGVLLHEVFHVGAQALVGQDNWKSLLRRVQTAANGAKPGSWMAEAKARAEAADTSAASMAEEIAAYAIENAENAPAGITEVVDRLVGAVKAYVLRRFGKQFGAVSPGQLRALAIAALRSGAATAGADARYSIADKVRAAASNKDKTVLQRASDAATDFLTSVMVGGGSQPGQFSTLALTPVRALFTELSKAMPSARAYIDTKQEMDTFRNEMNTDDDALLQDWLKWGRKNKEANSQLMDVMHESTLAQYDPSLTNSEAVAKGQIVVPSIKAQYEALPKEAKDFYAIIRDTYSARAKQVEDQVVANVKKALEMIVKNAKRAFDTEMERIKDEGLSGDEKVAAVKAAEDKLKMAQTRLSRNKAARIKRMRQYFESNRIKGPYFPLARFGNYFVTLRDEEGKVLSFEKYDSRFEQRARAEELRKTFGTEAVQESTAQYDPKETRNVDPGFLSSIDSILDEAGVDLGVRDAIYQTYLETMPDLSMRKARIHRKGTAGFERDAVRGFAHNMFHSAHQLSRLRYGMDLQDHLAEAAKQIRSSEDPIRTQAVYNEMVKSHQFTMNPEGSAMAHHVTSAVFLWTMAFNLSTAMVNTLQTVNVGIPNIAFDVETSGKAGIRMATRAMADAALDFVRGKGTVLDSSKLTSDEQAAVRQAYDSGLIDSTQAHDLAGVAESGIDYRPGWQRFMRAASYPMHQTERFNREVTFLAAYRVGRKSGLDHVAAIKKASDQTWATHFDNQSNAKPRFARGQAGKMLFALKSYQANLVYRIFRDLHQALQGKTKAERETAIKRFTSMFLLTSAAAGVRGAFFYSTVMAIAGAVMGMMGRDDDDPDEVLRKAVIEAMPDNMIAHAVAGSFMDGIPGYFTGTSLTNRVGMQDMWFHTNDRDLNADQQWTEWTTQLLGASAGLAHQAWMGVNDIAKGNIQRGIEKMLPAPLRNVAKAIRYANEGVQDKYGNPIVENVPWQDVFKQSLGFTPAEIADRFARNTYQNNLQDRIEGKARDARKAVARAMMDKDATAEAKAREDVTKFNERYPEYLIQPKSIMQSMRNMERRSDRMEYGVDLNPKLSERIKKGTAPSLYAR